MKHNGLILRTLSLLIVVGFSLPASAGWWENLCDRIEAGRQVNQRWPEPFIYSDRVQVKSPFNAMVNNGWKRQNLLGSHHFNEGSTQLSSAGEIKVHWVMTQATTKFRQVYVERSLDPKLTEQRMKIAAKYARLVTGKKTKINEANMMVEGRPANMVDATLGKFRESMMPPKLPPLVREQN